MSRPADRAALERHIRQTPVTGSPFQMRRAFAALAGRQPALPRQTHGGIACSVAGAGPVAALWLHGGGYVFGGADSHGVAVAHLAARLGASVLLPHYRRAPEATWPAPLADALAVLDAQPHRVAVIGDSAGGHLALHTAFARPQKVACLALIGPNTDRTGQSRTRARNSDSDLMNDDAQDLALARMALPGVACDSVDASPLLGPLHLLPPCFITCATNEVLTDDGLLLGRAAALAGAAVTLRAEPGLFHMWTLWPDVLSRAADTLDRIADFVATAAAPPDGTGGPAVD